MRGELFRTGSPPEQAFRSFKNEGLFPAYIYTSIFEHMQNTADNSLLCADCGINMRRKRPIMEKYVEKFSKGCKIKLGIPLHF